VPDWRARRHDCHRAHDPGEEIQWDWLEPRETPWGEAAYVLVGALSFSGKCRAVICEGMTFAHLVEAIGEGGRSSPRGATQIQANGILVRERVHPAQLPCRADYWGDLFQSREFLPRTLADASSELMTHEWVGDGPPLASTPIDQSREAETVDRALCVTRMSVPGASVRSAASSDREEHRPAEPVESSSVLDASSRVLDLGGGETRERLTNHAIGRVVR
jgi:hypothetical protein